MRSALLLTTLVALTLATWTPSAGADVLDRSVRERADAEARVVEPERLSYSISTTPEARFKARVVLRCFSKGGRVSELDRTFYAGGSVNRRLPLAEAAGTCVFRVSAVPWIPEDLPIGVSVTLRGQAASTHRGDKAGSGAGR